MSKLLTREERAAINRRAYQLSLAVYDAYRHRLMDWADQEKAKTGTIAEADINRVIPDISDLMESL